MKRAAILVISLAILAATLMVGAAPVGSNAVGSSETPPAYAALGVARVGGHDAYVHVWVVPPPGASPRAVAEQALHEQGARPVDPHEVRAARFSTNGLVWDQFAVSNPAYVTQSYNSAGEPMGVDGRAALQDAQRTWTDVTTSRFNFSYLGATTNCPSLVRECPGPQTFDGRNDVKFMNLTGCCTLGVTWYGTSRDEADMGLNSKFRWSTPSSSGYDLLTVMLHEQGHVAGLGHSSVSAAVMYATYGGMRRELHADDKCGISTLYPAAGFTGC